MKFDFHTHHERCGHAKGKVRDYIEAAIERNLSLIGISDHSPWFYKKEPYDPKYVMPIHEFSGYIEEVLALKKEYEGKIEVLLGLESDFVPEHIAMYREIYRKYPFDYLIGSVHASNGRSIFNRDRPKGMSEYRLILEKEMYYNLIQQSALSGMFQILGHIDGMKRHIPGFNDLKTDAVDRCLKTIGECDVAIEVNTSTSGVLGWQPSEDILERALFYKVMVTFGSDAHRPERVGDQWEGVRQKLIEIGYTKWAIFRRKQREMVRL